MLDLLSEREMYERAVASASLRPRARMLPVALWTMLGAVWGVVAGKLVGVYVGL